MAHLLERNHGERFAKLMDSLMVDWRTRRDALNAAHSPTKPGNRLRT
jgi:predicted metal-dependent hydrolase